MKSKKTRRTAYVPRLFLRGAAVIAVVPACAVAACGGSVATTPPLGVAVTAYDSGAADGVADVAFGVAADAFSVADSGFGVARDAFGVADVAFGVAADAFSVADTGFGVADAGFRSDAEAGASDAAEDNIFGVAAVAYPAYEAGEG